MDIVRSPHLLHRRRSRGDDEDEEMRTRKKTKKKQKKNFTEGDDLLEDEEDKEEDKNDESLPDERVSRRDADEKWKRKKKKAGKRVKEEEEELDFVELGGFNHEEKKERKKVVSKEEIEQSHKQLKKRGVVYLGSIPPFMKPLKLRQLLEKFGKLERMYLAPEDPEQRALRKKYKGNTGKKDGLSLRIKKRLEARQKCSMDNPLVVKEEVRTTLIYGTLDISQSSNGITSWRRLSIRKRLESSANDSSSKWPKKNATFTWRE